MPIKMPNKIPTVEETKKALKESIEHWERMINWTIQTYKGYPEHDYPNDDLYDLHKRMLDTIHENWCGDFCPLCKIYSIGHSCGDCPIGSCGRDSNWYRVADAHNVNRWVEAAKNMLQKLKRVAKEYNEKNKE